MSLLAAPLERVIAELGKLPSVGRKTAQRLAFHLLQAPADEVRDLAQALLDLKDRIKVCEECFNYAEEERCPVCEDARRDRSVICVVEEAVNLVAFERTGSYRGLYHVLGGALSPLRDIGPGDIRAQELLDRAGREELSEVILATNPNVEGEATAVYLARMLQPTGVKVSRLAQGLPAGGDLEFTDDLTLQRAFEGRREY